MSVYKKKVEETSGILFYWPFPENSGTASKGGVNATLTSTSSVAAGSGPLTKGDEGATEFNGTTGKGSAAINLSTPTKITIELWLYWTTNGSADKLAFEHTANANENNGAFNLDPDNSTGGAEANTYSVKWRINAADRRYTIARPSAATWHHLVFYIPRNEAMKAYVDGAEVTATARQTGVQSTGTFANSTLNFMCRNGASLFGAGKVAHFAIYENELSKANVEAHYAARAEEEASGKESLFLRRPHSGLVMSGATSI